jgi:hypothetical protein
MASLASVYGWITVNEQYVGDLSAAKLRNAWMDAPAADAPKDGASHDLCFVVDSTGSMQRFLDALKYSLPQFIHMTRVIGCVGRVSVLVYRDYDVIRHRSIELTEFSGWDLSLQQLGDFVKRQSAIGGGDAPEAAKTAARRLLKECSRPCIVFWYTDAPPHHLMAGSDPAHYDQEKELLGKEGFDWVNVCKDFQKAGHQVFTFLPSYCISSATYRFYAMLASYSKGHTVHMRNISAEDISKTSVGLFLVLIGHKYEFEEGLMSITTPEFDMEAMKHEEDTAGILPPSCLDLICKPMHHGCVHPIVDTEDDLLHRFKTDEGFRCTVYDIFDQVIAPDKIIALTYNTLFGTLWRAICASRDDPRRERLVDRMGATVSVLKNDLKDTMKTFIEMSYDRSADIEHAIQSAPSSFPAVILEGKGMTRTELMEVSRSCHRSILARLSTLLTGLRLVDKPQDNSIPLSTNNLFTVLPHLMCAGTMFSIRPAAILAILAVYTGSVLKQEADQFLNKVKGKWIDVEQPENISLEFCMLALKAPHYLTPVELTFYQGLQRIAALQINGLTTLEVKVGFTSNKTTRPDEKTPCSTCKQSRSATLMAEDGTCVICADVEEEYSEDYMIDTLGTDKSVWCECRSCQVHYAVINPSLLNVTPKCHFCRAGKEALSVECTSCHNRFLRQSQAQCCNTADYICPPCAASDAPRLDSATVSVHDYLQENGTNWLGLCIPDLTSFFRAGSLFKGRHYATEVSVVPCDHPTYRGKYVHNHAEILAQIENWIQLGQSEIGTCMLCFEDLSKQKLLKMCGKRSCDTCACSSCLDTWYKTATPGQICFIPNLLCPMCKKKPSSKTLHRHNRELLALQHSDLNSLNTAWYYGWCKSCYTLKQAVEKNCAEQAPTMSGFECEDCVAAAVNKATTITTKDCPACSVAIFKISGCNHIHCKCGAHFCYSCLFQGTTSTQVYDHMSKEHGGFFGHNDRTDADDEFNAEGGYYSSDDSVGDY